jgi:hypothetical protein
VLVQPVTVNRFEGTQRLDQQVNISNEKQVALSPAVAALAGRFLDSPASPDELLKHASVDVPASSQILQIHYADPIPRTAWCIPPGHDAEFVWRMEDVLEVYTRRYDPSLSMRAPKGWSGNWHSLTAAEPETRRPKW